MIAINGVPESLESSLPGVDYEHEHRVAEHEHEEMPEQDAEPAPDQRDDPIGIISRVFLRRMDIHVRRMAMKHDRSRSCRAPAAVRYRGGARPMSRT